MANGLALPTSDMDLTVLGLSFESKDDLILSLREFSKHLTSESCFFVEESEVIESATVPLIKLKANLQKVAHNCVLPADMKFLSIDITFDNARKKTAESNIHLSVKCCELIREYPFLKELTLILKTFVVVNQFDKPYLGGLSSSSIIVMLVSFMNLFLYKQFNMVSISRILEHFLQFYGKTFNECSTGISIEQKGFYDLNELTDTPVVIDDPINPTNNLGKTTYEIRNILDAFYASS